MKQAKLEIVNQTDSASLYTITFDDGVSEFEKFITSLRIMPRCSVIIS